MKVTNILKSAGLVILCATLFAGCSGKSGNDKADQNKDSTAAPTPTTITIEGKEFTYTPGYQTYGPQEGDTLATIKTNMGDIKVRLFPDKAPKAVENFITHAKNGYYDNVIFHRVINDFMIQGGDPLGTGYGGESKWGTPFEDEFSLDLRNYRGALSMANSGPNTNGSQFFIVQNKNMAAEMLSAMEQYGFPFTEDVIDNYKNGGTPHLDFVHTVFGQVYEGMDIVDKIADVKVDENDKPLEDVIIKSIEITEGK